MGIAFIGLQVIGIGSIFFALALLLNGDGSREQKMMEYFLVGCWAFPKASPAHIRPISQNRKEGMPPA